MKLRSKIILTTLSGGVLILLSGLMITSFIGMVALRTVIGENFKGLAKEAAHKVDLTLSQEIIQLNNLLPLIQEDLREIADRPDPGEIKRGALDWDRERHGEPVERPILSSPSSILLRRLLGGEIARGKYASLLVVDRRGLLVASMNHTPDYFHGDAGWWKDALDPEGKNIIMGDIYRSEERYVFDIALPIVDETTVEAIGAIKAVIDLKKFLEEPIHQIRFGGTGHAMLIDASGTVLICPILPTGSHITNVSLMATVSSPEPGWLRADDDAHGGSNSIVGFAPVSKINMVITSGGSDKRWHTFIRQDPTETYLPIRTLQTFSSMAGLGLIGLMTGIAIYLANRLIRPIDLISEGAKRIGRGELHHRLSTPSRDEIGELALEFNKMADQVYESTALMEQKIADRTNDLALVNQVSMAANRSLDLQKALKDTLVLIVDRMAADAGHIGVCDIEGKIPAGGTFSHEEWVGVPEDVIKSWNQKRQKTVQLDRPIVVDPKTPPPDGTVLPLLDPRYKEIITVPIVGGDGSLGIFSLARGRSSPFSPDTVDLLTAVARPIGMAIQNAQLYEKSKEIDRLKSELITNVSHEIRTPMTSILGFAELLQSEDIDQTSRRRFLSIIGQEGKRLTNLLNDLLDLSKLASGKAGWAIGPIDLRGVLSFAVNLVTPVAAQKGLILRIAPLSELPPVQGDEERLRQVMSNLLNNAIKFTPSGEIVTGAQLDGRDVTVFVRDSGHGIEPEDREKIFEKFYQVSGDQSGKPKGTGLGLPICREIITHLGGKIWCESAPGEGSTFFFTLQTRVPVKKPFRHSNE